VVGSVRDGVDSRGGINQGGFMHIMNYGIINHCPAPPPPSPHPPLHKQTGKLRDSAERLYHCSARDWDGKDYLRIIPRVVWQTSALDKGPL
jgi:hypothetical protein